MPLIAPLLDVSLPGGYRLVVEATDVSGDVLWAILHREVTRIEPMHLGVGHVVQVRLAALAGEKDVVLALEDEPLQPVRVARKDAEAHWPAVLLHEEANAGEILLLQEGLH